MVLPENQQRLHHSHLANYLDQQELAMLSMYSTIINFATDEIILKQGKRAEGIYIIIEGTVTVTAKILGESITQLGVLGAGNFLGEISFIGDVPCATSVTANKNVQCLFLTRIYIEVLAVYFPQTKYKLFNAISIQVCERLRTMHEKIINAISNSTMVAKSLFSEMINSLAKTTEITFEEGNIEITQLGNLPLFNQFTKEERDDLFKHSVLVKAPKNCTLIHKNDKDVVCYIVMYGAVQSSILYENKVAKLSVIGPSTLFASVTCVDKNSSFTITFVTCEPAILLKISETELAYFQHKRPTLWYKLFDHICRSLVVLEKSVDKLDIRLNVEIYNR